MEVAGTEMADNKESWGGDPKVERMAVAHTQLRTFDRYRYGKRSCLYPGYRFRSSGGPVFLSTNESGQRIRIAMNEPGVFTFIRYCECGSSKWIEGYRKGYGTAVIYVGRSRPSTRIEGLRLRPHTIRAISDRPRKTRQCRYSQQTLFD